MSNISYPTKTVAGGGSTEYQEGNSLPAAELQADFDAIANVVNGNLDEDNLSGGTQIPNSKLAEIDGTKVADHWDSAANARAVTSPGDTATITSSPATNLEEELERIRYRIEALQGYRSGSILWDSGGSPINASWVEPPIRGENLLENSGFEVFSGSSGDAPDGWTESGTIATSAIEAAAFPVAGADKRSLNITTSGSTAGGISQTITGLRSSTKYLFGVKYVRTGGTLSFSTSGGLASGNYQDPTTTDSSTSASVQVTQMIVQSTSMAADITVTIQETTGTSGDFNVLQAWFYEINDDFPNPHLSIPTQEASHSTEITNLPTTFATAAGDWDSEWTTDSNLTLSQYIPGPGYRLIYTASVQWASGAVTDTNQHYGFRLRMDDGSASTVDGPYFYTADPHGTSLPRSAGVVHLEHVVDNATPGATYEFSYQVTAYDTGTTATRPRLHPLIDPSLGGSVTGETIQSTSRARLRVERM